MCGRFTLVDDLKEFAESIGAKYDPATHNPRFNICPSQTIPVVLNDGKRQVVDAKWGIPASWGGLLTNARAEGIETKRSFRKLLTKQRALIPCDGFYEWQNRPGVKLKVPWYFRLKSRETFAFAGIWDSDPTGLYACIITTSPNKIVEPVHTRMPVMLSREHYEIWLSTDEVAVERLLECLVAYPAKEMESYVVSTLVNRASNQGPDLIKEVA